MKRNFIFGLFGGLIGSALLLMLLSAAGVVGARAIQSQPDAARVQDVSAATPLTSTFTYQGQLKNGGNAVNGSCQMAFRLYDDPTASTNLIGSPFTTTVPITNGLFSVGLNFGSNVFDSNGRWLDIQVNCGSGFVALTPRQALTPAPYALALPGLRTQPNSTSPNIIGGYEGNVISDTVVGGTIAGGGQAGLINRVTASYATIGGGAGNTATGNYYATIGGGYGHLAAGDYATIGGGYENQATGAAAAVPGGEFNHALGNDSLAAGSGAWADHAGAFVWGDASEGYIHSSGPNQFIVRAGGGVWFGSALDNYTPAVGANQFVVSATGGITLTGLRLLPGASGGTPNVIGGYAGNVILATVVGGTIAGGGQAGLINRVNADYATVGGGEGNIANSDNATVGGGYHNTASDFATFIGGGYNNTASGSGATVGGGGSNTAKNDYAMVGGGEHITATGRAATVAGGSWIVATGDYATVGGGENNTASGQDATVGGGNTNTASGYDAAVGGGYYNTAHGGSAAVGGGMFNTASGFIAAVSGGERNTASGYDATVGGGSYNTASGSYATVPGGALNSATMSYTLAAGRRAQANHVGAFVWADSTDADFASTANDQFLIRAAGGVGINTNQPRATVEIAKSNGASLGGTLRLSNPAGGTNAQVALDFATTDVLTNSPSTRILANDAGNYSADLLFQTKVPGAMGNALQTNMKVKTNGTVEIDHLGSSGSDHLCLNTSNEIASCSSSLRYKNNVNNLTLGLDAVAKLHPVTFNWKDSGQADLGFVAEDVNQVTPLLTTLNAQGQIEGVKYDRITAVLVKGMQEQQAQIVNLQQQNAEQLAQIRDLQAQQGTSPASFNLFNVLSVIAVLGMVVLWWQQRRSRSGGTR